MSEVIAIRGLRALSLNENEQEINDKNKVLTLIFQKLRLLDLYTCRLVCKSWKSIATAQIQLRNWESRNFLNILDEKSLKNYLATFSNAPADSLFSCFYLELNQTEFNDEDDAENFFKVFSHSVKSLTLTLNYQQLSLKNSWTLENILRSQSSSLQELNVVIATNCSPLVKLDESNVSLDFHLENLNKLTVTLFHSTETSEGKGNTATTTCTILEIILSKIPVNKPLKISLLQWEEISTTLKLLEKYELIGNLKFLGIAQGKLKPNEGELNALVEAGVQLECFDFNSNGILSLAQQEQTDNLSLLTIQEVYGFVHSQANYLKELRWSSAWNFRFSKKMTMLEKLVLNFQTVVGLSFAPPNQREARWLDNLRPLIYHQQFPVLKELELIHPQGLVELYLSPQPSCTTLKTLRIVDRFMNEEKLQMISTLFSDLTTLTTQTEEL